MGKTSNLDDNLRSAETRSKPAIERLRKLSVDDLYEELGARATAVAKDAITGGSDFNPSIDKNELTRAPGDLKALGERLFRRWSASLHQVLCGTAKDDADLRQEFMKAVSGKTAVAPLVAGMMVATFSAQPAVAAVVAALVVKIIVEPAHVELCKTWEKALTKAD